MTDTAIIWTQNRDVDLLNFTPDMAIIEDIAHGQDNLCRYTGQCVMYYPVSIHAIVMSHMVGPNMAMYALFHDSAEAYLNDMNGRIKHLFPKYIELENHILQVIMRKFVDSKFTELPAQVKLADELILYSEMKRLFPNRDVVKEIIPADKLKEWYQFDEIYEIQHEAVIKNAGDIEGNELFLQRFYELGGKATGI